MKDMEKKTATILEFKRKERDEKEVLEEVYIAASPDEQGERAIWLSIISVAGDEPPNPDNIEDSLILKIDLELAVDFAHDIVDAVTEVTDGYVKV